MKAAEYTKRIISRLPYWFAMKKKSKDSLGAAFLNAVGMELDEMAFTLDYLYEQLFIDSADTGFIDTCYKTMLPDIDVETIDVVTGNGTELLGLETLSEFFNYRSSIHQHEALKDIDAYYVDTDRKILYSRKPYASFSVVTTAPTTYALTLTLHHIWNYFDEFGLLLDTPRLYGESNTDYKERIKDVFKNPSGSDRTGLLNGIARELGCRVYLNLDDSSKDIVLLGDMISPETVKSGDEAIDRTRLLVNTAGQTVLHGDDDSEAKEVTYIHSIELHQMHEYTGDTDRKLQTELFYTDGTATPKLKEYASLVNKLCPIMWNYARWDESYWINDLSQFGYVPHITDASIEGFRSI